MRTTLIVVGLVAALILIVVTQATFVIREGEQAVVTQFGNPVRVVTDAGLQFKTPFIQTVNRLEKRLLPWDGDPENITTRDKKQIFIDVWARWRIGDGKAFFKSVRTIRGGHKILDDLVDSAVRDVVARNNLIEVVRSTDNPLVYESSELQDDRQGEQIVTGRGNMEKEILKVARKGLEGRSVGIQITEVHIKRVNYVKSVRETVYGRMVSERMRIASLYESEAEEEKNKILGLTQKELDQIQGEMQKRSAEIRGDADAEVIRITASAYGRSLEFFSFLRRLEAYKASLLDGTRLVISTDNDFFRDLIQQPTPKKGGG